MEISFIASLANIQSAITIGDDGATRLRLDIPESEIANAIKLVLFKGQSFKVTIENDIKVKPRENKDAQDEPELTRKSAPAAKRKAVSKSKRKAD